MRSKKSLGFLRRSKKWMQQLQLQCLQLCQLLLFLIFGSGINRSTRIFAGQPGYYEIKQISPIYKQMPYISICFDSFYNKIPIYLYSYLAIPIQYLAMGIPYLMIWGYMQWCLALRTPIYRPSIYQTISYQITSCLYLSIQSDNCA